MILIAVIGVIGWLVLAAAVVVLCRAAHQLDNEIERESRAGEGLDFRLPFAS